MGGVGGGQCPFMKLVACFLILVGSFSVVQTPLSEAGEVV